MGLFDPRVAYKPFEYPVYNDEGWMKQSQAFWLFTEIPMQGDVKNWKENLTEAEKNLVGNILLGFAQTETVIGDYWTGMVTNWFPKPEIKQMAMAFGYFESLHSMAYSYLNETLGLEDFEAFLHVPETAAKFDLLVETTSDYNHHDLKHSPEARKEVARSLAVFSAFAEGVSLYSSFAVLYSFQMRNLLKGIGQQMKWSVRDESLHSRMGCQLFRHLCEEYPEIREQVRDDVHKAAEVIVEMEHQFIDMIFEMGDLENLKKEDLKNFILRRCNEKLQELGYEEAYFTYDKESAKALDWFYQLTGGETWTDFFALRPTDYSKAGTGEDWDDLDF
jgi:ribonucleoside-diphosphate reductase beta chain